MAPAYHSNLPSCLLALSRLVQISGLIQQAGPMAAQLPRVAGGQVEGARLQRAHRFVTAAL